MTAFQPMDMASRHQPLPHQSPAQNKRARLNPLPMGRQPPLPSIPVNHRQPLPAIPEVLPHGARQHGSRLAPQQPHSGNAEQTVIKRLDYDCVTVTTVAIAASDKLLSMACCSQSINQFAVLGANRGPTDNLPYSEYTN